MTPKNDLGAGEEENDQRLRPATGLQLVLAGKAEHALFEAPTVSFLFEPSEFKRIAVEIVDDRGIESLKVMEVK